MPSFFRPVSLVHPHSSSFSSLNRFHDVHEGRSHRRTKALFFAFFLLFCTQVISSAVKSLLPTCMFWPESFTTGPRRSAWLCWRKSTTPADQVSSQLPCRVGFLHSMVDCGQMFTRQRKGNVKKIHIWCSWNILSAFFFFCSRLSSFGRRRRPAGGGHVVREQARPRHGSDLLPQHAGAGGGARASAVRVHPPPQDHGLPERPGVSHREVLRRHPGHQEWGGVKRNSTGTLQDLEKVSKTTIKP